MEQIISESSLCVTYQPTEGFSGTDREIVTICNNSGQCDTVVVVMDVIAVKIPQGFSPNDDGINEFFIIEGAEAFDHVSIEIFNRWGNRVYESKQYKNDWDGTSVSSFVLGDKHLPAGTYFYLVNFNNGKKPLVGYVYISR